MHSHQTLFAINGKKISRKTANSAESVIVADSGEQYYLQAGKARNDKPSTLLGNGKFGRVKLAIDENKQTLAVKIFELTKPSIETEVKNEIEQELQFSSLTQQTGVKSQLVVVSNKAYLFKPYVEGVVVAHDNFRTGYIPQLAEKINAATGAERLALFAHYCEVINKVIDAIKFMQQKNVFHGDMHAGNVIYNPITQTATIIDFNGRSKLISEITPDDVRSSWSYENATVEFILARDFCRCLETLINEKDFNEYISEIHHFVDNIYAVSNGFMSEIIKGQSLAEVVASTKEKFNQIIAKMTSEHKAECEALSEIKPETKKFKLG